MKEHLQKIWVNYNTISFHYPQINNFEEKLNGICIETIAKIVFNKKSME